MTNNFFEIKNGNFTASEKNKVNNVDLSIEKQGEIISLTSIFDPWPLDLFSPKFMLSITL